MGGKKWAAFYAEDSEWSFFESETEAIDWLSDKHQYDALNNDGYSEFSAQGQDCILRITHRSKYVVTDRKENYCQKAESEEACFECPEEKNCKTEPWPYGSDIVTVGDMLIEPTPPSDVSKEANDV